jgi:hypothetical protein
MTIAGDLAKRFQRFCDAEVGKVNFHLDFGVSAWHSNVVS